MKRMLLELFWPPKCPVCQRVMEHCGICSACRGKLPSAGDGALERVAGITCAAPLSYEGVIRSTILKLKFSGRAADARPLGLLLGEYLAGREAAGADVITWVPLSRKRRWKRGFDQAKLIAGATAEQLHLPLQPLLRKTVDVPAQSSLRELAARRANVLGVYEALPGAAGRRILLIDDVCTTGCTMAECARVLLDAGAQEVFFAAAAVTVKNERSPLQSEKSAI